MGSFESKSLTPQEQMKQYKREISRAVRELDRERAKLERQQDKIYQDMKKAVSGNQERILRQYAKDYARTKKQIQKFYTMRTHMMGVEMQLQSIKSTDAMGNAVRNATKSMVMMSRRMNMPQLTQTMQQFAMESAKMTDVQDVLGEQIDDVMGEDDDVSEEDAVVSQVIEELKQSLASAGSAVPIGTASAAPVAPVAAAPVGMGAGSGAGGAPGQPPAGPGGAGGGSGSSAAAGGPSPPPAGGAGGAAGAAAADDLAARLARLKGQQ